MPSPATPTNPPRFARPVLLAAAAYNVLWGAAVILFPDATLRLLGLPDATDFLWQCIGMIVGVYGIGYGIAAFDPRRHWPIVLVGLLGKLFGPVGFLDGALRGDVPWSLGWTILTNDLIWWGPFALILRDAWSAGRTRRVVVTPTPALAEVSP